MTSVGDWSKAFVFSYFIFSSDVYLTDSGCSVEAIESTEGMT